MSGSILNPTVAALVVAIGEQLDMVDAAVHALQVLPRSRFYASPFLFCNRNR